MRWTNTILVLTSLALEYDLGGVTIGECTPNVFCYDAVDCCSTDAKKFYIDPKNGFVHETSSAASEDEPEWWSVDSIGLLRGTGTVSGSPSSIPTIGTITSAGSPGTGATGAGSTSATDVADPFCPSPSLSAGAGVGIGIGASAGVATITALVWLLLHRYNKRKHLQDQTVPEHAEAVKEVAHQAPPYNAGEYYPGGTTTYGYQDVARQSPPREEYELQNSRPRHELS